MDVSGFEGGFDVHNVATSGDGVDMTAEDALYSAAVAAADQMMLSNSTAQDGVAQDSGRLTASVSSATANPSTSTSSTIAASAAAAAAAAAADEIQRANEQHLAYVRERASAYLKPIIGETSEWQRKTASFRRKCRIRRRSFSLYLIAHDATFSFSGECAKSANVVSHRI